MPEGDTIYRAARALDRVLRDQRVETFESVFPHLNRVHEDEPISGRTILGVASQGKHLLMRFSGNLTLRTHMRMNGSWHIYRRDEPWRRSRSAARILIATAEIVAVGFTVPVAEWIRSDLETRSHELKRLGPDLLGESFDGEAALGRLRERPDALAGDAILDQTVMSGVGNVYKSEVLFLCRVHPRRRVGALSSDEQRCLIERSRDLLRKNVSPDTVIPGSRNTTFFQDPSESLWVYGRGGRPCRICGTPVARALIGTHARVTYWCPSCQKP